MCTERRLLPPAAAADSCTFRVANEPENFPICQNPKVPPPLHVSYGAHSIRYQRYRLELLSR